MGLFSRGREQPPEIPHARRVEGVEDKVADPAEMRGRERPDFGQLATQRREAVGKSMGSRWEKIKGFFRGARDVTVTLDARIAYGAEVTRDVVGEKARSAAHATVEAGRTVKREAVAAGKQVKEWGVEGAKDVVHLGRQGVEAAWGGLVAAKDATVSKFVETKTRIADAYRDKRDGILNAIDMRRWKSEQGRIYKLQAQISELQRKVGMSQDAQMLMEQRVQERVQARLAERGINPAEASPAMAGA